jgi:DNA polymerase I
MAQQSLDLYNQEKSKPEKKQEAEAEAFKAPLPETVAEEQKQEKKRRTFPLVASENLPPSYFVSASYDGRQRKAVIKLYEPKTGKIYFWYDNTGHKPYCLTNLSPY